MMLAGHETEEVGILPVEVAAAVHLHIIGHGFWCCCGSFTRRRCTGIVLLFLISLDFDFKWVVARDTDRHDDVWKSFSKLCDF